MIAGHLENFARRLVAWNTVSTTSDNFSEVKVQSRETIISVVEPPPSHGGQGKDGVKFGMRGRIPTARVDALCTTYAGGSSLIHERKLWVIQQMLLDGVWSLTNVTKQQQILVSRTNEALGPPLGERAGRARSSACLLEGRFVSAEEATGDLAKCGTHVARVAGAGTIIPEGKKESDLESVVARTRIGGHVEALTIRLWCTVQNPSW